MSYTTDENTYQQPYDFEIYSYPTPIVLCCELKTTHLPSISFERTKKEKNKKMLHYHQIEGLLKASQYKGVYGMLVFDFQTSGNTYFLDIKDFMDFFINTDKKSISEKDVIANNGKLVDKKLLKINYQYNIQDIFNRVINDVNNVTE